MGLLGVVGEGSWAPLAAVDHPFEEEAPGPPRPGSELAQGGAPAMVGGVAQTAPVSLRSLVGMHGESDPAASIPAAVQFQVPGRISIPGGKRSCRDSESPPGHESAAAQAETRLRGMEARFRKTPRNRPN